jgi:hypothetical protein
VGSLGFKAENFNLTPITSIPTTTTFTTSTQLSMPSAAELRQQIVDMDRILKETELAEAEEARKAKKAVEAQKKLDEAEVEWKKKEAKAEAEKARKAKVRALAEAKKGKSVDRTEELGGGSEGRKDCDSCRKKGWKCEWRSVRPFFFLSRSFWS